MSKISHKLKAEYHARSWLKTHGTHWMKTFMSNYPRCQMSNLASRHLDENIEHAQWRKCEQILTHAKQHARRNHQRQTHQRKIHFHWRSPNQLVHINHGHDSHEPLSLPSQQKSNMRLIWHAINFFVRFGWPWFITRRHLQVSALNQSSPWEISALSSGFASCKEIPTYSAIFKATNKRPNSINARNISLQNNKIKKPARRLRQNKA